MEIGLEADSTFQLGCCADDFFVLLQLQSFALQILQMSMMLSVCLFGPDAWKDTTSVPFITGWEPRFAVLVPMAATTLMLSFQTFFRVIFNAVNLKTKEERGGKEVSERYVCCFSISISISSACILSDRRTTFTLIVTSPRRFFASLICLFF